MNIERMRENAVRFGRKTTIVKSYLKEVLKQPGVLSAKTDGWVYIKDSDTFEKNVSKEYKKICRCNSGAELKTWSINSIEYENGIIKVVYTWSNELMEPYVKLVVGMASQHVSGDYKYKTLREALISRRMELRSEVLDRIYPIAMAELTDPFNLKYWVANCDVDGKYRSKQYVVWSNCEEHPVTSKELGEYFIYDGHESLDDVDNYYFYPDYKVVHDENTDDNFIVQITEEALINYRDIQIILRRHRFGTDAYITCTFVAQRNASNVQLDLVAEACNNHMLKEVESRVDMAISDISKDDAEWELFKDGTEAYLSVYSGYYYKLVAARLENLLPSDIFKVKAEFKRLGALSKDGSKVGCVEVTMKLK